MKVSNATIAGIIVGLGIVVMVALAGAHESAKTPTPVPSGSPHGLIVAEQKPNLPDCVTEDSGPIADQPCVWDTWLQGTNPNPGRTPRYVIVRPDGGTK